MWPEAFLLTTYTIIPQCRYSALHVSLALCLQRPWRIDVLLHSPVSLQSLLARVHFVRDLEKAGVTHLLKHVDIHCISPEYTVWFSFFQSILFIQIKQVPSKVTDTKRKVQARSYLIMEISFCRHNGERSTVLINYNEPLEVSLLCACNKYGKHEGFLPVWVGGIHSSHFTKKPWCVSHVLQSTWLIHHWIFYTFFFTFICVCDLMTNRFF